MIINHNMNALNAHRMMTGNTATAGKSMEKLSSGLRINRAGDDAAGLAISEKMRGQIRGLDQAARNGQDGISMIQTAEGALNETHSILQRMRELAVQSSNDTNVAVDRTEIQKEMDELAKEVTRISNNTEFNTQKLINGGIKDDGIKSAKFHVGANANQDITLSINAMDAKSLGVSRDKSTAEVTTNGTAVTDASITGSTVAEGEVTITSSDVAATSGSISGTAAAAAAVTTGGTLNLKIDGANVAVTITDGMTFADAVTEINSAANTALGTSSKTYASNNAGTLNITSLTTGTSSSVEVVGVSAGTALNDLKLSAGADTGDAATLSVTGTHADGTTETVTGVATNATSVAFTGNLNGLTLTKSATATTAASFGTTTIDIGTTTATAATFVSGEKTADAVTEAGLDVSTQSAASSAITTIQTAIETVSAERSKLGAYQNRLEHTIANLGTASENLTSAESRVRDVDMAKEMMAFSKNNILSQAAQAMLAQANQQPQGVLQLLR